MTLGWRLAALGAAACAAAALWPLTPALSARDALQARIATGAIAVVACTILAFTKGLKPGHYTGLSMAAAAAGVAALWMYLNAAADCLAEYDGRTVVIGREFTDDAAGYVRDNPGLSPSDRLLDAGGDPARIWTTASIGACRFWVSGGGLASIPLFAVGVGALLARGRHHFAMSPRRAAVVPAPMRDSPVYDAFISYRHSEPDRSHAAEILESLESKGLRVSIDVRDFAPNEHFLAEMERCIKQSRYVLCIVTSQYLDSDHTSEEAIISKTLDLAERRKRLVPLIFDRVALPVWLHGLVGIDFTPGAGVDPIDRLLHLLSRDRLSGAP